MGRKRASQLDESGQRINCKVCGSSAVGRRCGAVVCEACKKFFIRNRNSLPKLRCVNESGHNVGAGTSSGDGGDNGVKQICEITPNNRCCSRCRIIKCLELGMRMKGKKTKASIAAASAVNSGAIAGSPSFSVASPMSVSVLKETCSLSSIPQPPSVDTSSTTDPTVDLYIPKKQRAAMNIKQQSPFNPTSSESMSPSWFASPSPPLMGQPSPFSVSGASTSSRPQQPDQFASQRSLPVFPSAIAEASFRSSFPMESNNSNNSKTAGSPDNEQTQPSASQLYNGFLAYQKFTRDLQARSGATSMSSNCNNNNVAAGSPTPFAASSYAPPTSLCSFLPTATATSTTSPTAQSPNNSPPWAYLANVLCRASSQIPVISNNNQQQQKREESDSPMDEATSSHPIVDHPSNLEAIANEAMLRGIVRAYPSLQLSSKQLELHVNTSHLPSPSQLWQTLMANFEDGVGMGLSYVKSLPGIRQINLKDRSEIFCDSFLPMASAQQLLDAPPSRPDGYFLNMSQDTRNLFLSYFPAYTALAKEVHDIGEALSNWNPSFIEFVFLEAMLFYRSDVPNLQNPMAVGRLRSRLTRTLEAYLQKTCRTEDEAQGAMRQFYAVYNLLMRLPDVHNAVLSQTANDHPEIFGVSALLGELYSHSDAVASTSPEDPNTVKGEKVANSLSTSMNESSTSQRVDSSSPTRSQSAVPPPPPISKPSQPSPSASNHELNQNIQLQLYQQQLQQQQQQQQQQQRLPTPCQQMPPSYQYFPPPLQHATSSSCSNNNRTNASNLSSSSTQQFDQQQQQQYEQQLMLLRQHLQQSSPMPPHFQQHSAPLAK